MTGVIQPFPDDAFLSSLDPNSSFGTLRPLDFSNLLSYNDAPLGVSPVACPSIFSPSVHRAIQPSQAVEVEPQPLLPQNSTNALLDQFTAGLRAASPTNVTSAPLTSLRSDAESGRQDAKLFQQLGFSAESVSLDFDPQENSAFQGTSLQPFFLNLSQDYAVKNDKTQRAPELVQTHLVTEPMPMEECLGQPTTENNANTFPAGQPVPTSDMGSSATSTRSSASDETQEKRKPQPRKVMSAIEKAAERRRKNRESSSRCYYNRKRIIENLDKQISQEKRKLTSLYDRALELRHENARLKKDVVTQGIALPTNGTRASTPGFVNGAQPFQLQGYLQMLQSTSFQTTQ